MTFTIVRGFADSDFRAELLQRIYKKYQTQNEARFFLYCAKPYQIFG